MEIEVEIRSIVSNLAETEEKLRKFKLVSTKTQTDEYFLHPCRNFYAKPDKLREYLRIRDDGNRFVLEYKKASIRNAKKTHSEEYVAGIHDPERIKEILLKLGFKPFVTVKKKRKNFDCGDFKACLDSIELLGDFLEIEAKKDFGSIAKTKQKCIEFLKKMDVEYNPAAEKGYPDLIAEKKGIGFI